MNSFSSFLSFCQLKGVNVEPTLLYKGPNTYDKVDVYPEAHYEVLLYTIRSLNEVAEIIVRKEMYNNKTHFSIITTDIFFKGYGTEIKSNLFKKNAKLSDLAEMVN